MKRSKKKFAKESAPQSSEARRKPGCSNAADGRGPGPSLGHLCGLSTQLALEFVCAIVAGALLGYFIDKKFDSFPLGFILGFIFGTIAAGVNVYRFVCRFYVSDAPKDQSDNLEK
jgi:hypothetical protein